MIRANSKDRFAMRDTATATIVYHPCRRGKNYLKMAMNSIRPSARAKIVFALVCSWLWCRLHWEKYRVYIETCFSPRHLQVITFVGARKADEKNPVPRIVFYGSREWWTDSEK